MFGAAIYQHDFSLCTTSIPQICPIPSGPFNVTTWIPAPSAISQSLPAFLFGLPDLGVETKLTVTPTIGSPSVYLCIVAGLSNDPQGSNLSNRFTLITPYITTTSIVVTALAFLTGLVGLVVAILYVADVVIKTTAAATGTVVIEESYNSVVLSALAPAAPGLQDLVMYCQHIAFTGQFQLAYPNFYRTFAANFAWSLGIVSSPAILSAVDTMRAQYGGHPDQDLVRVDQDSSNLGPNISSSLSSARIITFGHAVAANVTLPPTNVKLLTGPENSTTSGIAAYLYALRVPTADAFMTVLLVFLMILGALTVVMMIGWGIVVMLSATVPKLRNFAHEYGYLYSGRFRIVGMAWSGWRWRNRYG
ncbi:hypothetical protein BC936DRAFT_147261 [Jimgerdemannia flammicorona]|uniref:TRP C-terminal domain-containing protein n=1 Tax=Jimgerdemannia flammicorona TaxID=994334 RepID=A0A433D5P6_9FUNG|nr:hypothetical protein BC936DRAFT_147261 [Jimgerdemannia flammicorona]